VNGTRSRNGNLRGVVLPASAASALVGFFVSRDSSHVGRIVAVWCGLLLVGVAGPTYDSLGVLQRGARMTWTRGVADLLLGPAALVTVLIAAFGGFAPLSAVDLGRPVVAWLAGA
jgi:hypothetical protein